MLAAASDETFRSRAEALAVELELPLVVEPGAGFDLLLVVAENGLELRTTGGGPVGPVRLRFRMPGGVSGRRATASRRQPIARAIGLKRHRPRVVDATAGLGRDALLLATLGCTVTAVERSAVVGVMLRDALERAGAGPELGPLIQGRLRLIIGDAREVLARMPRAEAPDVVYLDPMYAPRGKSRLPKKEMRILRRLVGDDADAGELLAIARRVARERVVVKRTLRAQPLAPSPKMSYKGKIARYDVYVTRGPMPSPESAQQDRG